MASYWKSKINYILLVIIILSIHFTNHYFFLLKKGWLFSPWLHRALKQYPTLLGEFSPFDIALKTAAACSWWVRGVGGKQDCAGARPTDVAFAAREPWKLLRVLVGYENYVIMSRAKLMVDLATKCDEQAVEIVSFTYTF